MLTVMKVLYKIVISLLILAALFLYPFSIAGHPGVDTSAVLIGFFNFLAFITALISYTQFILPKQKERYGEYNRVPFQAFNMIFVLLFFMISISFLIANKSFFSGYEKLTDRASIQKYYLSNGIYSIMEIFIASSLVVNVIYILTHITDYYGRYKDTSKKSHRPGKIQ